MVGPSGVGKDTLLDGARQVLADEPGVVFVRREITRPAEAGGEIHTEVSEAEFSRREAGGDYALSWRAHGLGYGLPATLVEDLAAGRRVVANVSRAVIPHARSRFRVRVVNVTADLREIGVRLALRGREDAREIAERLARAETLPVSGEDVVEVRNDGTVEEGVARMVSALRD